jgi:hypothetical protein
MAVDNPAGPPPTTIVLDGGDSLACFSPCFDTTALLAVIRNAFALCRAVAETGPEQNLFAATCSFVMPNSLVA